MSDFMRSSRGMSIRAWSPIAPFLSGDPILLASGIIINGGRLSAMSRTSRMSMMSMGVKTSKTDDYSTRPSIATMRDASRDSRRVMKNMGIKN